MPRRGENIYKRKDGRWEGRYKKYEDSFGKVHYGYVYARNYNEVKEKLYNAKSNQNCINFKPEKSATVKEICELWLDEVKLQNKYSTYVKYYNIINNHITPILGKCDIQRLGTFQIREFVTGKLSNGRLNGSGGLSPKSVSDCLSVIRLIIAYSNSIGISCNANVKEIKIKEKSSNVAVLTNSQIEKLSNYLVSNIDNINLGILISLYTGIRLGEICALRFSNISLKDKIMSIKRTMQRIQNMESDRKTKTKVIITAPKSESSIRDIPLPDFIIQLIKKYFFYDTNAYVLSGECNTYVEPRSFENKFKNVAEKCGIYNVKFHTLRHTFATHSVECGFETKSLSEILGHSSVNITLNRYVHSSMEMKRINMEKLAQMGSFCPSNL